MRNIAFIGVGNMAGAIIGGLLKSGAVDHAHLILSDVLTDKCAPYVEKGAVMAATPAEAAEAADCIVLSVKPQNFSEILPLLAAVEGIERKLIITIAAGISSETVKTALHGAPVVRVLPNTPMLIGLGVSVICRADDVSAEDFDFVCRIFEASGSVQIIDEADMILIERANKPYIITMPPRSSDEYFQKCGNAYRLALQFKGNELYYTYQNGSIEFKRDAYPLFEQYFGIDCEDISQTQELMKLEDLVQKALIALHYEKDRDYVVHGGKACFEDESDGSLQAFKHEMGLFLSLANGLDVSEFKSSLSERAIYFNFIHPYGLLARFGAASGTSATACSFKKEFKSIYDLDVMVLTW